MAKGKSKAETRRPAGETVVARQRPVEAGTRRPAGRPKKSGNVKMSPAESTEERIKEAARKLFTQKGFAATRTRDIAAEAGINLALLNYYFRTKQKLFDLIMEENFKKFLTGISFHVKDETLTFEERVTKIISSYIDFLREFPDLPLFVINEIRGNPHKMVARLRDDVGLDRSRFFQQIAEAKREGKNALEPFHFIANLVGLTVFPFLARPVLQRLTGVNDEQFDKLIEERKNLIPKWIELMMKP
jgi:AcrR family transcriptional regulator